MNRAIDLPSAEDTVKLGEALAKSFYPDLVIALEGGLGAGKTTFVQGVLKGLGSKDQAQSPTFGLLHIYQAKLPIFHFDLYRLKGIEEFRSLGFEEYFDAGGVCLIEWSERITPILPNNHWKLCLEPNQEGRKALLWA